MIDPRYFRPSETEGDWEDNAVSNTLAWASEVFTPKWCASPEHFTSRWSNYLFTSCPCCLFYRGAVVGFTLGLICASLIYLVASFL